MHHKKIFIFDFDSTLIQLESFDVLAEIALSQHSDRVARLKEIRILTDEAMQGRHSFSEALKKRLSLLPLYRSNIEQAISVLKTKITPSFEKNTNFFQKYRDQIFIVSGGFYEIIKPIANLLNIKDTHIYANHLLYNYEGKVVGFDYENPLSQDQGKIKLLKTLNFPPELTMIIGDGYTDYEVKEAGYANTFYAFTENITREEVVAKADAVIQNLEGLLLLTQIDYDSLD